MAPREGNSIAPHGGVVDERLNVHGVKGLKVCDLSICPDNVGCNTFSVSFSCPGFFVLSILTFTFQTALLIGEKCAVLVAEDLGYSGSDLDMKVPTYHAPAEFSNLSRL
jgi:alcohol oxidase